MHRLKTISIKLWKKIKVVSPFLIAFILSFLVTSSFSLVKVSGESMFPTYTNNDLLLAYKYSHTYQRGDVVVVDSSNLIGEELIIKRIVGTEGDIVKITNGKLYVNGDLIEYDNILEMTPLTNMPVVKVPEHQVFLLGDNRNGSLDSRVFGCVDEDLIRSKICYDGAWLKGIGHFMYEK